MENITFVCSHHKKDVDDAKTRLLSHKPRRSVKRCDLENGKPRFLDRKESKTPKPIDIKLDTGDYVGDLTPHAHFGISTLKGGGAAYA